MKYGSPGLVGKPLSTIKHFWIYSLVILSILYGLPSMASASGSLILHYKFDEATGTSAFDSSLNGYSGTLVNGPTWAIGKMGGAIRLDGVNDYLNTVDDPLDLTGSMTLSMWVYRNNSTATQHLASKNLNPAASPWQLAVVAGTNKLRMYTKNETTGLSEIIDGTTSVPVNAWSHIVFVRDASTSRITYYIDGVQDAGGWKTYNPNAVGVSAINGSLGSRAGGGNNFLPGLIDDFRIYNGALSSAEIVGLYNEGNPVPTDNAPTVSIISPTSSSTVSGTIAIDVSAQDDIAVKQVEIYINGVLIKKDSMLPYRTLWSTALKPNGVYNITAIAIDSTNHTATSSPVTVTVDNPTITNRPNIVVVLTDDQRADTTQYMPILNSLFGSTSIKFENTFDAIPLCCPDRATFFTGLYSHNHGIKDNAPPYGGAPMFNDVSTIATWLNDAGYKTGLYGKYMNAYNLISPYVPPGWDEWHTFVNNNNNYYDYQLNNNGVVTTYGSQPADYYAEVLESKAIDFINNTPTNEPLFLYYTPTAPHSTGGASDSAPTPAPQDIGLFANLQPWRPQNFNESDVSDKPTWVKLLPSMSTIDIASNDNFRIKQIESLQAVDRNIGNIVNALQQTNRMENTIFVFASDNGLTWGEHRWWPKKWCTYEECVRIPFWVRVPGVPGRTDYSLVNTIDFAPTMAELAGVIPASKVNGWSLASLIKDPSSPWRTETYFEYIGNFPGPNYLFRTIRNSNYVYIEYENGDKEFYDLTVDPYQESNSINKASYSQIISDMKKELMLLEVE